MRFRSLLLALLGLTCATPTCLAQNKFLVAIRGTTNFTNETGRLVTKTVTERSLLDRKAKAAGLPDATGLALVYHVQGGLGDTLDVVSITTGQVLDTIVGFYFGEAFGRTAITNAPGTRVRRLDYIYTHQNSHSLGSAVIDKIYAPAETTNSSPQLSIQGSYQYVIMPQGGQQSEICSGTFWTIRPFVPRP